MKNTWRYLLIQTILIILWNQVIVSPFRAVSLIFHKFGHALSAVIFGHGLTVFKTVFGNSRDIIFSGDSWIASFIMANGGYISSILFCLLVFFLKKTKVRKFLLGSTAIIYIVFCIAFASSVETTISALIFSLIVILVLMIQTDGINDLMLDIIGISMAAYVIYDAFVDTILLNLNNRFSIVRSWSANPPGDMVRLAELTGFPVIVWGIIWFAIAVVSVNILLIKVVSKR
ncbi:M50 family metallopeptidase [Acetivibrio clariflavus]|uniref:Peptidase M50B-like n=1 Tax=Acetivibrio clariflavus (strain DSM 19732 / NBRC 101661 / EBR45) TaxID=720554 RepID=G8M0M2_ACECE|nr:M50 family metallopeptidase [Acetivibrio clariflavus]AEV69103.1 hypothetical protein Clocl_2533 [Acetivibrio clariflavus DSM 19732]